MIGNVNTKDWNLANKGIYIRTKNANEYLGKIKRATLVNGVSLELKVEQTLKLTNNGWKPTCSLSPKFDLDNCQISYIETNVIFIRGSDLSAIIYLATVSKPDLARYRLFY